MGAASFSIFVILVLNHQATNQILLITNALKWHDEYEKRINPATHDLNSSFMQQWFEEYTFSCHFLV